MRGRPIWRWALWPVGLLLLMNAVVLVVYTLPKQNRERALVSRVEKLRSEVEARRAEAARAKQTVSRIEENTRDEATLLTKVLPTEATGLLPALREMEALVRSPGISSSGHGFKHERLEKSGIRRMSLTLPVEGGYRSLVTFLARVEESQIFLTVDSIVLRRKDERGGDGGVLQIGMSAWFRDEESQS